MVAGTYCTQFYRKSKRNFDKSFFFPQFSQGKEDLKTLDEAYICLKLACLIKNAPPNIVEYFGAAMLPRPSTIQLFLELMPSKCEHGSIGSSPCRKTPVFLGRALGTRLV